MHTVGIVFMVLAGLIAAMNFYLTALRYLLHRLFGRGDHRHISGLPAFGTFALILGVAFLWNAPWAWWLAACIAIFDTGGLPWFALSMLGYWIANRNSN